MAGWLEGKVAMVTGGASGIGRAVVERFVQEGAKVCIFDLAADKLQQLSQLLPSGAVVTVQGDVTRLEDNRRGVEAAVDAFGRLDVFVGNAGVFDGSVTLEKLPDEEVSRAFDEIFHVNVKGYLLGAKAALPELLKTSGNMVFTASSAGFYPNGGGPIYTASKHAVVGLIQELAYELAPRVRVNGVAPGGTVTNLRVVGSLKSLAPAPLEAQAREARSRSRNPLRLAMRAEDHVAVYLLLASDQTRAMTGEIIHSDGGLGVRGLFQAEKS
ncbi:MAG TPA: 3-(cis-5,6-dihydroxycyclohexa-1,3-dien-1-yl)propanoate dehydrogenase [Candidatus Binatia bacterium]|nr:3-(cis-5,6-dihydroxycyclohexa-1,3-dien-1-yl)propanoate dehydrogenase [Candidatus Binatia bacterium]